MSKDITLNLTTGPVHIELKCEPLEAKAPTTPGYRAANNEKNTEPKRLKTAITITVTGDLTRDDIAKAVFGAKEVIKEAIKENTSRMEWDDE